MPALNHVAFTWRDGTVRISVDGRDLVELVREVESGFPPPGPAGGYSGLEEWVLRDRVAQHFTGGPESHLACGPREKTVLLGCDCGEPGCWPLMARVAVSPDSVTWSDFEQPHRRDRWNYDGFGPFVFARREYEQALTAIAR